MNLEDMLSVSLKPIEKKTKKHSTIIRGARSILSGFDGSGKTTTAFCVLSTEYKGNPDLVCVYVDADDKSMEQVYQFAEFFKTKLNGQYLNLPLINRASEKKKSMLDFLIAYAENFIEENKEYILLIDNLNHITGSFENDNSKVTQVRIIMEQSFLKRPNVRTILIAHSGKNDMAGIRGATSIRSAFGEEIQIRKDLDLGIVAEVRKDSEDYHKTNLYELNLINKENFEMEFKELQGHKLIEDKTAYQAKRLEDILLSLILHIQQNHDMSNSIVADVPFTQAVYLLASPSEIHTDDKKYLTPNFVSKGLNALYTKVGIEVAKHPVDGYKMFKVKDIDVKNVSNKVKPITITDYVKELVVSKIVRPFGTQEIKPLYDIKDLEEEVLVQLKKKSLTAEQLRMLTYKSKEAKPTRYSKTFAKDNLSSTIDALVESNKIVVSIEGRKKLISIKK
jgi:hypothetical protein